MTLYRPSLLPFLSLSVDLTSPELMTLGLGLLFSSFLARSQSKAGGLSLSHTGWGLGAAGASITAAGACWGPGGRQLAASGGLRPCSRSRAMAAPLRLTHSTHAHLGFQLHERGEVQGS
jgi:hypothetical protein